MNNILKEGMVFQDPHEAADYIEYTTTSKCELIYKALSHYCRFHMDSNKRVYIDEVFMTPIPFKNADYQYEIGNVLENKFGKFVIKDRYMRQRRPSLPFRTRLYFCECLNDGVEFELSNQQIKQGCGCPDCGRRKILPDHSFYDEYPELMPYITNPEEAKLFAPMSSKKISCTCIYCGATKMVAVGSLAQHGFSCSNCSDGVSYPNKFIQNLLDMLNVAHIPEHKFSWSDNKIYDQYLPENNIIIENHGLQHYKGEARYQFPMSNLKAQVDNDTYKYRLAIKNGISDYVILDCSHSTLNWMKNIIMSSSLPLLLGFSDEDIDWEKCHERSCASKVREVWALWNQSMSVEDIAKNLGISKTTARTYIHKGIDCNRCVPLLAKDNGTSKGYIKHSERNKTYTNGQMKPIYCKTDDIYFSSRFECEKYYTNLFPKSTGSFELYTFINKGKSYKGKFFSYITREEFNQKRIESLVNNKIKIYGNPFKIKEENIR